MCFANKELFNRMSRIKSRSQVEVCGDCGASDPSWASINRGILLCAECCSVHRSLGRHISQVKSLRQGSWIPSVLNLVNTLNANGANSVWEHGLLDPSLPKSQRSKKPSAKDPLHPNKAEFIRAKHMNLAYIPKPDLSTQDGLNPEIDLSKQLHASVRSTNIEITLRLLVQGADPNYFHEDKGSTPLHVAAKFGQPNQVELLLVYGADLFAKDAGGLIPLEVAKNNSHMEISSRLYEAQFDVTDRICYFLCNKRPDHLSGPHIIFPDQRQNGISEQLKIARGKLQLVPNKMFEELVMDIYDEVDRREMEAIWATSAMNPEIGCVPFLPTNPHLSATRNQGRQKLARFSPTEFASLLNDVLVDAKRRENMATLRPMGSMSNVIGDPSRISNLSDDEPLYDAVASDDDYAALTPVIQQSTGKDGQIVEVEQLRKRLEASFSEIHELRTMVQKLASENTELKSRMEEPKNHSHSLSMENGVAEQDEAKQKRPVSMYEARGIQHNHHNLMGDSRIANSMYQMGNHAIKEGWPTEVEVKTKTDLVTRRIQELWNAMKEPTVNDQFNTCADNIRSAVNELVALFPEVLNNEVLKSAIKQLKVNVTVIQNECSGLQFALVNDNQTARDTYMPKVLECAFNLAKATKTLVTNFEANQ